MLSLSCPTNCKFLHIQATCMYTHTKQAYIQLHPMNTTCLSSKHRCSPHTHQGSRFSTLGLMNYRSMPPLPVRVVTNEYKCLPQITQITYLQVFVGPLDIRAQHTFYRIKNHPSYNSVFLHIKGTFNSILLNRIFRQSEIFEVSFPVC